MLELNQFVSETVALIGRRDMTYVLVLIFACGSADGCGWPDTAQMPSSFPSYEQCQAAGMQAMSPQANPTGAVATFHCSSVVTSE